MFEVELFCDIVNKWNILLSIFKAKMGQEKWVDNVAMVTIYLWIDVLTYVVFGDVISYSNTNDLFGF